MHYFTSNFFFESENKNDKEAKSLLKINKDNYHNTFLFI